MDSVATALEQLDDLPVADRSGRGSYEREAFGQRWKDVDRNGCGQRDDALKAAMTNVQLRPGTHGCVVESGLLHDPYTGEVMDFVKSSTGGGVDVDHLVPLGHAWQAGARDWGAERREQFANDLDNLQPTAASVNRSKGDAPIDAWLPPNKEYRCEYATQWVEVKSEWALAVTTSERVFVLDLLARCR